jgi:hypothetical protein
LALAGCSDDAVIETQTADRIVIVGHGEGQGLFVEAQARMACADRGNRPILIYDEFVPSEYEARRYVYECID